MGRAAEFDRHIHSQHTLRLLYAVLMGQVIVKELADFFEGKSESGIVSAYLFGSHAADRAHRESDIDIGVPTRRSASASTLA